MNDDFADYSVIDESKFPYAIIIVREDNPEIFIHAVVYPSVPTEADLRSLIAELSTDKEFGVTDIVNKLAYIECSTKEMMEMMGLGNSIKYLFIDFDGTVRETIASPSNEDPKDRRPPFKKDEVKIINGVKEKLKEWEQKGWQIIGVSNQSGVEKGLISIEEVEEIASYTMDLLGVYFPFYFAPYRNNGTLEQLKLRKPDVGMAEEVFRDWGPMDRENSFMVGDYISDEQFAKNLGIRYVDIRDFLNE